MEESFPLQFNSPKGKESWLALKDKLISDLNDIIEPGDETKLRIERANERIAGLIEPKDFRENVELKYDKDFEKNCIVLAQYSPEPIENVSVRRYFTLLEHYNNLNNGRKADKLQRLSRSK